MSSKAAPKGKPKQPQAKTNSQKSQPTPRSNSKPGSNPKQPSNPKPAPKEEVKPKPSAEEESKRQQWAEIFRDLDVDGSGFIDASELGKMMRCGGLNPTEKEIQAEVEAAQKLINHVDKDGNQVLSLEEFCDLMSGKWKEKKEEKCQLRAAFENFDKNGDGYISESEMMDVLCNMGNDRMNEDVARMLFHECDANGDGKLDYNEFLQLYA